ncbi:hypothetical protein G6F68_014722 [Rhizopus microsporus]|nr:hypothetical protein G6F68_014722 [Rhizopus microsporus]
MPIVPPTLNLLLVFGDGLIFTPWLYNPTNKQYISYDDPVSLKVKVQYAADQGLAGLFAWSVDEDNGELLSVIASILDKNPTKTSIGTSTGTATGATNTITADMTTNSASSTSSGGCANVPTWDASTAYTGGSQVVYNDKLYKAKWWNQGETPSLNDSSWSVWTNIKC